MRDHRFDDEIDEWFYLLHRIDLVKQLKFFFQSVLYWPKQKVLFSKVRIFFEVSYISLP